MSRARPCVFFDRDGIVNVSPGAARYVRRWADLRLIPEFADCLRIAAGRGYLAVIVSNQSAVAKGLMTAAQIDDIHRRLRELLRRRYKLSVKDIVYCPHNPGECSCRKPHPGMLLNMARKHNLDLKKSWMVGDQATDIEAGRRAGCRTIYIGADPAGAAADACASDMAQLPVLLASLL